MASGGEIRVVCAMGRRDTKFKVGGPTLEEGISLKCCAINRNDSGGYRRVPINIPDFYKEFT